jgi:uncharacterized protein
MREKRQASGGCKRHIALITFACVLLGWIAAWLIKLALDAQIPGLAGEGESFAYWTLAKLLVWIFPSVVLIKKTGRTVRGVCKIPSWKKLLAWSLPLGGLPVIQNVIGHLVNHTPVIAAELSFALVSAVIIAPVFEEFAMRGAVMGGLLQRYSFPVANTITAFLFVLLHFPGWYFTHRLMETVLNPFGGALSIFVIGWLCGLAARRSETVVGAIIVHFLNNLSARA